MANSCSWSALSKSEIVAPLVHNAQTQLVLEVDSDELDAFDQTDRRESDRILRDGFFEVALSQALRAKLRSDRPSGTGKYSLLARTVFS